MVVAIPNLPEKPALKSVNQDDWFLTTEELHRLKLTPIDLAVLRFNQLVNIKNFSLISGKFAPKIKRTFCKPKQMNILNHFSENSSKNK